MKYILGYLILGIIILSLLPWVLYGYQDYFRQVKQHFIFTASTGIKLVGPEVPCFYHTDDPHKCLCPSSYHASFYTMSIKNDGTQVPNDFYCTLVTPIEK